jgi:uncharacterized protein (DUF1501 family)
MGWQSAVAVALGGSKLSAGSFASRALVNLNLFGGNDSNNMIVPLDPAQYAAYASARGPLAIPRSSLLPIDAPRLGAQFGLHPKLAELHGLFQTKALAFVANVGDLQRPMTRADVGRFGMPTGTVDHISGNLTYFKGGFTTPSWTSTAFGLDPAAIPQLAYTFTNGMAMIEAGGTRLKGSRYNQPDLLRAMAAAPIRTQFPNTALGNELKQAAQLVYAARNAGALYPVILCSKSGFDTHVDQLAQQDKLFTDLSQSLNAFYLALGEIGAQNRVTLSTQTEFNRTLRPNATQGTEHAWGGHQIVMGSATMGGDVFGTFPSMALGGSDDAAENGTWIPTTSTAQYQATLAQWLGISSGALSSLFPNLTNFSPQTMGFVV